MSTTTNEAETLAEVIRAGLHDPKTGPGRSLSGIAAEAVLASDWLAAHVAARVAAALAPIAEQLEAVQTPRPTEDSGAYEFWRGYRHARDECVADLRAALPVPEPTP